MPRQARLLIPDLPLHIVHRGHNRQQCFFQRSDYATYLGWLEEYSTLYKASLHSYVLMSNHVHILVSLEEVQLISHLIKRVAQRYAQYLNRRMERSGAWWGGRFYSCPIASDSYLFKCQRYIELNPVRAGMVGVPAAYPWSSYKENAGLQTHGKRVITPHPAYMALHSKPERRPEAYRSLFEEPLIAEDISAIRLATTGNFLLSD